MSAALIKALRVASAILQDIIQDGGEKVLKVGIALITLFLLIMLFFVFPVTIHERIPVAATKEQALWYYHAAKRTSEMTVSPCDPGVYVDWQEVIAIDAVRYKQNFRKSSAKKAFDLAQMFIREVGICVHCTGEGEDMVCTEYTIYAKVSIEEVMDELGMNEKEQEEVISKYRVIEFNFLIGFNPEGGHYGGEYGELFSGDLVWPAPGYHSITSPFGMRLHPTRRDENGNRLRTMHYGIDIGAPGHADIVAAADGIVQQVQLRTALVGGIVVINHGRDETGRSMATRYLHVTNPAVKPGDIVKAGQKICEVGLNKIDQGQWSTAPHLHFEVMINAVNQDPRQYFSR